MQWWMELKQSLVNCNQNYIITITNKLANEFVENNKTGNIIHSEKQGLVGRNLTQNLCAYFLN